MSTNFIITQANAVENNSNIYEPLIYFVEPTNKLVGYAIPFMTLPVNIKIPGDGNLPVLRAFTCSGSFTLFHDFNGGQYYIFASHDQTGNTQQLWVGNNPTHTFGLAIDTTKQGLQAFSLTKLS